MLCELQVYNSDSQFLKVYSIYSYYKIVTIFPVLYTIILVAYCIHISLYLLLPDPILPFPSPLSLLVTTKFSVSVSLLLFCFIHQFVVHFRFHISLGQEDPLEKGMATHSSILAWRVPWTEEPGGLQSLGSQRVGHN